jgi:hypothetical protein
MCKNQSRVCFGLGEHEKVDLLEVRWPDGGIQKFENLGVDRRWLVIQSVSAPFELD